MKGKRKKYSFFISKQSIEMFTYLNPINFRAPLIFVHYECAKINGAINRQFFAHLGARNLIVYDFLKYHLRPKYDGILQYFSPP